MSKKKKELNPILEKRGNTSLSNNELKEIAQSLKDSSITESYDANKDTDSFYKSIMKQMFNKDNIGTKTEYIGVRENFFGAKATFLGIHCNIPYLKDFVDVFEEKRVSLDRKGRKEILMALQERRQEIEQQRLQNMNKMFNI